MYAYDVYVCSFLNDVFSLSYPFRLLIKLYMIWKKIKDPRFPMKENAGRKTGNNLLSYNSVAVLPSAIEGLTSVFGMETCVSPHL